MSKDKNSPFPHPASKIDESLLKHLAATFFLQSCAKQDDAFRY